MLYFVKAPAFLKKFYPKRIWKMPASDRKIYLTFDDGPHPVHTLFVLEELKKYHAKATFFCIGRHVMAYPDIYQRILDEGHSVGNHTQQHLNGWKTNDREYLDNVAEAANYIDSNLFRPPYGRITSFKEKLLREGSSAYKIIMWTILSGDFDKDISEQRCLENVLLHTTPGSIIVFHDSEKASKNLRYVLPRVLSSFAEKYQMESLGALASPG